MTVPAVGSTSPLSIRANVDLPGAVGADDADPLLGEPHVDVGEHRAGAGGRRTGG